MAMAIKPYLSSAVTGIVWTVTRPLLFSTDSSLGCLCFLGELADGERNGYFAEDLRRHIIITGMLLYGERGVGIHSFIHSSVRLSFFSDASTRFLLRASEKIL